MFTGQNALRYPTKWALNPSAYDNISADQVDWAALAQQWIQMKETCPPEMVPPAPPPPSIAPISIRPPAIIKDDFPQAPPAPSWNNPSWNFASSPWPATAPVNSWGWNNTVTPTPPPPPPISAVEAPPKEVIQPLLPTPPFNSFSQQSGQSYTTPQPTKGYWTVADHAINSKEKSPYKERQDDFNHGGYAEMGITLDAAKRKQLPAWIRQGLEKMEREKQKELERKQDLELRKQMLEQKRIAEEEALKELQQEGSVGGVKKSKFDSDSEDEDLNGRAMSEEESEIIESKISSNKVKDEKPLITQYRTKEERLQDVMMCVRQTLTEILLEVTNDEILVISRDTINRSKNSAQALRKTNALTSITGGLGLGIYGESSGSDSENSDDENSADDEREQNRDSDAELEKAIRQRRSEFEKTSQEIELRLLEEETAMKQRKTTSPMKVIKRTGSLQEDESNDEPLSADGEKCNKQADGPKSSKPQLPNNQQSSNTRNKSNLKIERDHNVKDKKKMSDRKKSKYQKSSSSHSESDTGTDSETDSDSNTTKSESTECSVQSKQSSYEKKTNLCRKKSQKSVSPDRESKKRHSEKTEKSRAKNDQFDIASKEKSVKDNKALNEKVQKRELSKISETKKSSVRERSSSRRGRSRSHEDRKRSRSRERRRRSRSNYRRHRSRSRSRDSYYRSRSRTRSRDRRRRSRSRRYDKSYSSDRRNRSRDRRHRSRSNVSRRTRSRSRGKKSHRH